MRNTKKTPANKTIAVVADPVFDKNDARLSKLNSNKKDGIAESTRAISDNLSWEDWNGEESDFYIPRLPYTRNEAETVSKLAPANQQKISLDFEATRDLALSDELKNYRIVHFATHGILNSKNPAMSGLVFSLVDKDGKFRNGFLRTDETYNLKLSADLVVLSGCKTGLGKEIRGEGLVGMTRGFMYAGASRVMVSLWDVDDQATAELMKFFYQNLLGKKMGYGQSLRQAQLSMIKDKKYSAPFYWSAFTLQGEF
jgi:CHAT domain-containing protein